MGRLFPAAPVLTDEEKQIQTDVIAKLVAGNKNVVFLTLAQFKLFQDAIHEQCNTNKIRFVHVFSGAQDVPVSEISIKNYLQTSKELQQDESMIVVNNTPLKEPTLIRYLNYNQTQHDPSVPLLLKV